MENQKKFACTLAILAAFPLAAVAETADGGKDSTSLVTTDDYIDSNSTVRKDDDKINIFNELLTVNDTFRVRVDNKDINANSSTSNPTPKGTNSNLNAEFWLHVKLYKDWKLINQIESDIDLETDKFNGGHDVPMSKLYVEGTVYNNIKARAGKFDAFSSYGRAWDTEVTGGKLLFDNKVLSTKIMAGRHTGNLNDNVRGVSGRRKRSTSVQSKSPANEKINVGTTVSYMEDLDVRGSKKDAIFGGIDTDTGFNDDWYWMTAVSKSNIKVYSDVGQKIKNDGILTEVRYKLTDRKGRNSYDVSSNYRHVGSLSGVSSIEDYSENAQGVQTGATYIPWKSWRPKGFYLTGKQVTSIVGTEKQDANVIRGQLEYNF